MLIMTGCWQWADLLNTKPLTYTYIYISYVIHRFHFLSSQTLPCALTNSISLPCTTYPLLPEQNCEPHSLTCLCRTPDLWFICPSTKQNPLPYPSDLQVSETTCMVPVRKSKQTKEGWWGEGPRQGLQQPRPFHGCIHKHWHGENSNRNGQEVWREKGVAGIPRFPCRFWHQYLQQL